MGLGGYSAASAGAPPRAKVKARIPKKPTRLEAIRELQGWLILNKKVEEIKGLMKISRLDGKSPGPRSEVRGTRSEKIENFQVSS